VARKSRYRIPSEELVAAALRDGGNPFQWYRAEGPCRHLIRSNLCLQGCIWARADAISRRLVARARSLVNGTPAPRGWDHNDLSAWTETQECEVCDRRFIPHRPDHHYCSGACKVRAHRIGVLRPALTRCGKCGTLIEDPRPGKKFCTRRCAVAAGHALRHDRRKARLEWRSCPWCALEFEQHDPRQTYCSKDHARAAANDAFRRRKLNGHAIETNRPDPAHLTNGHAADRASECTDQARSESGAQGMSKLDRTRDRARGEAPQ
jgi:hypothetical protein